MCRLWAEVLGVERVESDQNFFELGGDSLAATMLAALIQSELDIELSASVLLNVTTPQNLVALLSREADGSSDSLIIVQPTGSRTPLFAVHDLWGGVFYALHLSTHLGPEQPLYALRPPYNRGTLGGHDTLQDLATYYVSELKRVRPEGPYQLFGYSLGGNIAFEMAIQLGDSVALLAVGDSVAPSLLASAAAPRRLKDRVRRRVAGLGGLRVGSIVVELTRWTGRTVTHALRMLGGRVSDAERYGRLRAERRELRDPVMRSLVPLIDAYRPRERFSGSILLFHTDTDMSFWGLPREEHRGWARDISGEIREVHVACQHVELPSEPFIGEVAATLRTFLRTSPPER